MFSTHHLIRRHLIVLMKAYLRSFDMFHQQVQSKAQILRRFYSGNQLIPTGDFRGMDRHHSNLCMLNPP